LEVLRNLLSAIEVISFMNFKNFSSSTLLILLFSVQFMACKSNEPKIEEIPNGINFLMAELYQYPNSEPIPAFGFYTNDDTKCGNNLIYQSIHETEDYIEIEILGYNKPSSCHGDPAPATSVVPLFLNSGEYKFKITYESEVDDYTLVVTDSTLQLTQDETYFFSTPRNTLYWRYPEKSFALLAGTSTAADLFYDMVFDSLEAKFNFTEFAFPDSGLIPYPDSLTGFDTNHPARFFKYDSSQDALNAGIFIQDFGRKHILNRNENRFILFEWKNNIFSTNDL